MQLNFPTHSRISKKNQKLIHKLSDPKSYKNMKYRQIFLNSSSGAAERGVQGVQLHTLEILWVCKTPFLRTLSQLTFAQQMLCLSAHDSKGRPRSFVCLSLNGVKRYGRRLRYLLGRLRTFRAPRSFQSTSGTGEDLVTHPIQGASETGGRLRTLEWLWHLKKQNTPRR